MISSLPQYRIFNLGSGSDYVMYLQELGITCSDMAYVSLSLKYSMHLRGRLHLCLSHECQQGCI